MTLIQICVVLPPAQQLRILLPVVMYLAFCGENVQITGQVNILEPIIAASHAN